MHINRNVTFCGDELYRHIQLARARESRDKNIIMCDRDVARNGAVIFRGHKKLVYFCVSCL